MGLHGMHSRPGTAERETAWLDVVEESKEEEEEDDEEYPQVAVVPGDKILHNQKGIRTGCWYSLKVLVGGIWNTRDLVEGDDKEEMMRTTVRELVIYCFFLVVFGIVSFGMASPTQRLFTTTIRDLFIDDSDETLITSLASVQDFWDYMENDLLDTLYLEEWYNKGELNQHACPQSPDSTGPCPLIAEDRNILMENKLIGVPRLRQLRVSNSSCKVSTKFRDRIPECYAEYEASLEDTSPFLPQYRMYTSSSAWRYKTALKMGASLLPTIGKMGTYTANGAVQDLTLNREDSYNIVHELKEALWIDRGTRAVFLDFTVYNVNVNLFCQASILFEFPATGGLVGSTYFTTVQLLRYVSALDFFLLGCEVVYLLFIIYFLVEEVMEITHQKWKYFRHYWNIYDLIILFVSIANVVLNVGMLYYTSAKLRTKPTEYVEFKDLTYYATTFRQCLAVSVFLSWIKLFKYFNFNKVTGALTSTVTIAAPDIVGFFVMFFIVFSSFAQMGFFAFGNEMEDYKSFYSSMFIQYRTLLGDFNFPALKAAQPVVGPLFFAVFIFFNLFVLLSMLIAIINDTYIAVKADLFERKAVMEMSDYFIRGYNNILAKAGMRRKSLDIDNAVKIANEDEDIATENVRENLKRCNFSNAEIEMFLALYDIGEDGVATKKEDPEILKDRPVSGRAARESARAAHRTLSTIQIVGEMEFNILSKRVDKMESVVGTISRKLDNVIDQFDDMDKEETKKKKALEKMLDGFMEDPASTQIKK